MTPAKKFMAIACLMAAVGFAMPITAGAAGGAIRRADREGTWDFYVPITYTEATTIDGPGGSSAEINDDIGVGFGAGYNFNNRLQLGGWFNWNSRTYDATVVRSDGERFQYGNEMETTTIALNGTYYFMDKNFTPFISAMVGYTWGDINIHNGPTEGYCWYDPWSGYSCSDNVSTQTQSDWTYGGGLGVRYDFSQYFSIQGSYNKSWTDFDTSGTTDFDIWRIDFIIRLF
ncbi:hypothetical protein DSCW_59680 [Desulfosarcina widdelii]|uniref:Outer membrane protein beta-barrel domain-containing protein n=2 Tax=Desulfosarcina widdelii TaxID=947919 RepID=A0A5K7ZFH1_9BACT|nr:hypothetical protein DSCW_59680 [Desulfosarcina widdelii]